MAVYQPNRDLKSVLRDIFAAEGQVTVTSLWDQGWVVRIREVNGTEAERTFSNEELDFEVLADWLARTFADLAGKLPGPSMRAIHSSLSH